VSRRFRTQLKLTFHLIADERHEAADHYGIPISHVDPRAWSYPDGFIQPAAFALVREREIFRFVQKPRLLNLAGATGRPPPEKLLAALRKKGATEVP